MTKKKKKKRKKGAGRPPKPADEKSVASVQYTYGEDERDALVGGIARLEAELGRGIMTLNRQFVIRLCLKRLKRELKDENFSMVKEYLVPDSRNE